LEKMMSTPRSFRDRVSGFATYMSGLRECAAAVEAGRKPSARALNSIGLDPKSFDGINWR
jgi:hypothetical protein